jgi:hypothetical protein
MAMTRQLRRWRVVLRDSKGVVKHVVVQAYDEADAILQGRKAVNNVRAVGKPFKDVASQAIRTED